MNPMAQRLPFRHKIRNSSHGGLRLSTLLSVTEAAHNTESVRVEAEETMFSLKSECASRARARELRRDRLQRLTRAPGTPSHSTTNKCDRYSHARRKRIRLSV